MRKRLEIPKKHELEVDIAILIANDIPYKVQATYQLEFENEDLARRAEDLLGLSGRSKNRKTLANFHTGPKKR